jgi:cytochrome P450
MTGATRAHEVAVPPHVDPARVVDFDLFDDQRYVAAGDPIEGLRRLRDEIGPGLFWSPHYGGHWFITDNETIFEAARTPEVFSNVDNSFPPAPPEEEAYLPPITMDGEEHAKYRMPLMRAFSPARMKALEADIRAFAVELIDSLVARGQCDFMQEIAEPLPVTIFMKLMGYDLSRRSEFHEWASWMSKGDTERRDRGYRNAVEMTRPLFDERRLAPKDDVLSRLLDEEINGAPISQRDLDGMCVLLFGAGLDTVVNSMGFGMQPLARNPALQDRLRANPALIPEAIEEMLRRLPVSYPARRIRLDSQFHGATLKTGERVVLMLGMGNLDPAAFPEPDSFDVDRQNKAHMTFNTGPHRCIGSHLARVELAAVFDEWLKRMPNVRIDPARTSTYRGGIVFAIDALHLLWDAPANQS